MTRVKICGLTRQSDLDVAVDAGADAVGVICDVPVETPREVVPERARELLSSTPPFVTGVLVTMPDSPDRAQKLLDRVNPDAIQLHGDVSRETIEVLRSASVDVVLAIGADELERAERYDGLVDGFLVDSADADGGGGTGETHDWDRTRRGITALDSPVILAGGLTPENVADAIDTVHPFAVDVASGVEASGGRKDHEAVRSFLRRANAASYTPRQPTEPESP